MSACDARRRGDRGTPAYVFGAALAAETAEHAEKVLGLPAWIWQLLNLALFLAVLVYFVARPMTEAFRKRQLQVEETLKLARERRAEAARFEAQMNERMALLEREVQDIRRQGKEDGESARTALEARAREEAERVREGSQADIERRLAAAKAQLRQVAADLTAAAAVELLSKEIRDDDRRRLLEDGVQKLKEAR